MSQKKIFICFYEEFIYESIISNFKILKKTNELREKNAKIKRKDFEKNSSHSVDIF